jgi:hypothetical protein
LVFLLLQHFHCPATTKKINKKIKENRKRSEMACEEKIKSDKRYDGDDRTMMAIKREQHELHSESSPFVSRG